MFRHKLLLILPAVLIPAIVTPIAIKLTPPVYETRCERVAWMARLSQYQRHFGAVDQPVRNAGESIE